MDYHEPKSNESECVSSWDGPVYVEDSNEFYEDIHELVSELKQPTGPIYICTSAMLGDDIYWVPTNTRLIIDKYVTV